MLNKVFTLADKYPLVTLAAGTLGIMYLFENYGSMNGSIMGKMEYSLM